MAGIIKNQILKHLSRFVKDLHSDKINVSTLKGEGELTDLKLDEEVLTELLALPIWMKIKKAHCNRARLMIQWTKLKSIPIRLILDTVEIQIEACEELRPVVTTSSGHLNLPSAGKYGFANKVVDGITVTVESVDIKFFSKAFESKVQISRIRVESRSPQWKKVDLTHTRLKDMDKGEVLTFKEIEWQTLRLEAQSTKERHLAPLRLLTNQAKARVTIKKKLIDCTVVGCRLSLILDDLLWVLTDSQILAAVHFMSSLSGLVKQATEKSQNEKSARKLETLPEYRAQQTQAATPDRLKQSDSARIFDAFDVKETSYHLMCEKIDLHFCDDPGGGRSCHPDLREGGAGQVQLTQFMIDFYPYHLAKADRRYWPRYCGNDLSHWLKEALASFRGQMMEVLFPQSTGGSNNSSGTERKYSDSKIESIVSTKLSEQFSKLMETCLILKIRDVCLYKVTTSSREVPLPFLSSYLERPKDISAIHMEFTWFYYPGGVCFPLPSPKLYTQIHPLQVHVDTCTVLWLNSFVSNLQNCLPPPPDTKGADYMDVRVEIVMPKIVFEEKIRYPSQKERPHSLQIQAARVVVSNFRSHDTGTPDQLLQALSSIETKVDKKFQGHSQSIPNKFTLHSKGLDKIRERQVLGSNYQQPHLTTDMLWTESRDVWFVSIDAVWADFCLEQPKSKSENGQDLRKKFRSSTITAQSESVMIPFVDSLPVQLWLYAEEEPFTEALTNRRRKDIQAILCVDRIFNIQLTHPQYLFLMRTAESVSEISTFLTIDTRKTFSLPGRDDSITVVGSLPRLEISFILPCLAINPEIQREDSSNLEDLELTLPEPTSLERTHKPLEPTSKWKAEDSRPSSFDVFATDSNDPFFQENLSYNNSTSMPSMESIKSSLTQGMKQGLSSIVVSFSKSGGQSTPDSDVTSLWSTESSENNFVHLDSPENELENTLGEEGAVDPNVEVAEEVVEDNSQSTGSMHNPYGREDTEDISVLTVCLNGIELKQNSEGLNSKIALNCQSLAVEELVKIPWNEFQSNFSVRGKKWRTETEQKNGVNKTDYNISSSAIKLEFTQKIDEETFLDCLTSPEMMNVISQAKSTKTPRVNMVDRPGPDSPIRKAIIKSTHPNLKADIDLRADRVERLDNNDDEFITLHSSTLKGVAEFFEDEIPPTVLPLQAFVLGLNLEVLEEKAPGMPTTKVALPDGVMIKRDSSGVFSIGCPSNEAMENIRKTDELVNGKKQKELDESLDMLDLRRKIHELEQQVSQLKNEKSHLLSQLQLDNKKQKQIATET